MRKIASILFSWVLLHLVFVAKAPGQGNSTPGGTQSNGRTYAMIMGISNYKFIRPLTYADSDAELFRDFLKSSGGGKLQDSSIFFLKNEEAKQANFWLKGMSWLDSKKLGKGDKLYIYLAGHGDAINEDEYFFLAYDCNPAGDKNNYLLTGTIQLYNLKAKMKRMINNGAEVIFIMDACRSNELPGGGEGQQYLNQAISEKTVGEIMMLATGAGQESLEDASIGTGHGLFTYFLVDGLSGLADTTEQGDKKITLEELKNYVSQNVSTLASEKYKRKQEPFFCCDDNKTKIIAAVDTNFMRQWILAKKLSGQMSGSEINGIARNVRTRGDYIINDTIILDLYNGFSKALKELNLTGNGYSAESYFEKMNQIAPDNTYTKDAKLTLAAEFINFAQSKINLYLEGRDVSTIQRIRSQLDADDRSEEISNSLDRMEKVARREFSEVGVMLEKAISYINIEDEAFLKSLKAKNFFFKANGYYEKGNAQQKDLKQAIQFAYQAYRAEPDAAYILNTLASLQLDNNKPDSTIYFARKAISIAPKWPNPYINAANAFTRLNKPDSAIAYFYKALNVDPSRSDAYVDIGYFYFQHRNLDSAKLYYERALKIDPNNVSANNNMGWLYRERREYQQALSSFRKSLDIDPQFFNAYNGISRVFTDMRQFDSARAYYQKAMHNYSDKLITSNYLGQFYQDLNQLDSARVYYRQAAVYDPNYDAPFINLGRLYAQQKQYDSARYYYNKAIELNNKNFRGFNQLGLMYSQQKNYDSAFHYLRRAMNVNPDNTIVLNNIGLAFSEQKLADSASKYFKKVIQLQPENPYAYNNLGVLYFDQKKFDSARSYYLRALNFKADLSSSLINLGLISMNQKNPGEAKYWLKRVVDVHPENTLALNYLESVYKQEHEYDSAIYYYNKALRKGIRNTFIFNNLGRLFFDTEKFDSAMHYYGKAIQVDSNNTAAYNNLGFVYSNLEQFDTALVYLKQAFKIDSVNSNASYNLGIVYNRMKRFDSSVVYFRKAILQDPKNSSAYFYLACSYAAMNRTDEALLYFKQALERGYNNYEYIILETDLDSIRKFSVYRQWMRKYFPKKYKESDDK